MKCTMKNSRNVSYGARSVESPNFVYLSCKYSVAHINESLCVLARLSSSQHFGNGKRSRSSNDSLPIFFKNYMKRNECSLSVFRKLQEGRRSCDIILVYLLPKISNMKRKVLFRLFVPQIEVLKVEIWYPTMCAQFGKHIKPLI